MQGRGPQPCSDHRLPRPVAASWSVLLRGEDIPGQGKGRLAGHSSLSSALLPCFDGKNAAALCCWIEGLAHPSLSGCESPTAELFSGLGSQRSPAPSSHLAQSPLAAFCFIFRQDGAGVSPPAQAQGLTLLILCGRTLAQTRLFSPASPPHFCTMMHFKADRQRDNSDH